MLLKIFLIFLINFYKISAQSDVKDINLPLIDTQNVKVLRVDNKEYQLSVNIPHSQRSEFITFDPLDNQLKVTGTINTFYPDTMNTLIVNYVADKNGYRASFKIGKSVAFSSVSFQTRLSSNDLKSLAG